MCGLSLAWVTSENSTSTSNADILSRSSLLDPILSPTVSRVRCWLPLSVVPRQLSLLPLCCPTPTALVRVPRQLLSAPLSSQLSFASPSHFRIRRDFMSRILCLVSRQNRQRNRLLWRPTHIVLQKEYYWIHTFPKGISAMWSAISLIQDLNSCRVHFLRR